MAAKIWNQPGFRPEFNEDMERGEYGFLPPSDAQVGGGIPTASKIYSFAITH